MKLTKQEVSVLIRYQRYQHTVPTFLGVLRSSPPWPWAVCAIVMALSLIEVASDRSSWHGWLLLGFMSGVVYMLFTRLWRSLGSWRVTREITDWKRVAELVRENENRVG